MKYENKDNRFHLLPTPIAVPSVDESIDCDPALAVISARFSRMAKDL